MEKITNQNHQPKALQVSNKLKILLIVFLIYLFNPLFSQNNELKVIMPNTLFLLKDIASEMIIYSPNNQLLENISVTTKDTADRINGCCGKFIFHIHNVDYNGYKKIYLYKINNKDTIFTDTLNIPVIDCDLPNPKFIGLSYKDSLIRVNEVHGGNGIRLSKYYPSFEFRYILYWNIFSYSTKIIRGKEEFSFKSNKEWLSPENKDFLQKIQVGDKITFYDIAIEIFGREIIHLKDLKFTVIPDPPPVKTNFVNPKQRKRKK